MEVIKLDADGSPSLVSLAMAESSGLSKLVLVLADIQRYTIDGYVERIHRGIFPHAGSSTTTRSIQVGKKIGVECDGIVMHRGRWNGLHVRNSTLHDPAFSSFVL